MENNMQQDLQHEIGILQSQLSSVASPIGDWKIIKCYEAKLQDKEMPYDLEQLLADRQAIRDKINELQEKMG